MNINNTINYVFFIFLTKLELNKIIFFLSLIFDSHQPYSMYIFSRIFFIGLLYCYIYLELLRDLSRRPLKFIIILITIPIDINIELLQRKKKKLFLTYCMKLHGTGLKPGTFEFVTNALTNYAIDYL